MEYFEYGKRLKEERERLGLSQSAFAALGGASKGSQVLYEKGKPCPSDYLMAISANGADVLYILTGRREQPALDDIATLAAAIELVEELLAKRRATLPPAKKADVIALAYDIIKGDRQGTDKVERMLRLVV